MLSQPHPALKEISQEEWTELIMKLTAYTLGFFRRHYGSLDLISRGGDSAVDSDLILPGGHSAADIAQEIALKVLAGARHWDPDQHGDLLDYMTRQVRSLTNHCFRSWSGKFEIGIEDGEKYTAEDLIDQMALSEAREDREDLLSTELIILDKDTKIESRKLFDLLLEVASGEPDLEQFVLAYVEDSNPQRRFIAEKLGITPDDVTNLVKRLRTKLSKAMRSSREL